MSWVIKRSGATTTTRRIEPSWKRWEPLPYQLRATDWLVSRQSAILPLRPGGRKTSITLNAFQTLRDRRMANTMLIIAPLRVCRQTWRQEAAKWEQFRGLRFSLLHGDKKEQRLEDDADIWLINPEGVPWLCQRFLGRSLPFDVVCIDELTRFKNSQSERFKALLPRLSRVRYRWGLTGSLAPNGHMDLFGQVKILDDGAALGRYITHYRDSYFQLGYDGFTYTLMPGAESRIVDKLAPYVFPMSDNDYAQLPSLVDVPRVLELSPAARKVYDRMKRDMVAQLEDGVVTAANSAACYSKLSQMANGAVYVGDNKDTAAVIHELKIEALDELSDELDGEPLLIAYEFNHDLERLKEWHQKRYGKPLPYLGKGTTATQETQYIEAWNRGELTHLAAHPASAGHGLNMQGASAANVAWFSITWDYELYDQLIRRIRRDGTRAVQIFNHLLIVKGTIDELKFAALGDKELTQTGLYRALNQVLRDVETQEPGVQAQQRSETMKLSRPGGGAAVADTAPQQTAVPAAETNVVKPRGWGSRPAVAQETQTAQSQREAIQERINPDANRAAFSQAVQEQAAAISAGEAVKGTAVEEVRDESPAPKTTRTRKPAAAQSEGPAQDDTAAKVNAAVFDSLAQLAIGTLRAHARIKAVELASQSHFAEHFEGTEDLFALADEILAWMQKP